MGDDVSGVVRVRDASVTQVSPLRIRLDGDTTELPYTPDLLVSSATFGVSDRVVCGLVGRRVIVLGRAGGATPFATDSETQTGTATDLAVTPAGLASLTATDSRRGLAEFATDSEAVAGSATNLATTPANLVAVRALPVLGQTPSSVTVGSGSYSVEDDNLVTFSGVSSINLNDVFDGLGADAYQIIIRAKCSTSGTVLMRLREAGSDLTSGYSYVALQSTLSAGPSRSTSSSAGYIYITSGAFQAELSCTMHMYAPAVLNYFSLYDSVTSAIGGGDRWSWSQTGQITTAVYSGLKLYVTSGTLTGSIKVVKVA